MDCFAGEVQKIEGLTEKVILYALTNSLRPTFFAGDLFRKPPKTFAEAMERSHGESNVEEYLGARTIEFNKRQQKARGVQAGTPAPQR